MVKYLIIHNKHEGCYDFHCYQDEAARIRLTSITINPPKIYMFNTRDEAQDFFEEYINDVDCIDIRCKRGDDVEHIDYCTCGVIELDDKGEPILFYNKKNQIFLMEHGPQLFVPNHELKNDIKNFNLTNRLMRKCKSLGREQRKRYIELGKYCEDCNAEYSSDDEEDKNKIIKTETEIKNEVVKDEEYDEEYDEDTAPEFKVLKSIPSDGITAEALIYKLGQEGKDGLDICLKNKWAYRNENLIMRATSESFNRDVNKDEPEVKPTETKEEPKKPKTVRKKKTENEEKKPEEKKPEEKKQRAPRKKKSDAST